MFYESKGFFSFHSTNAWQQSSGAATNKVLELSANENLQILKRVYYGIMQATAPGGRALLAMTGSARVPS